MTLMHLCIRSFGKPLSWENVHLEKRARTRPLGREHLPQWSARGPLPWRGAYIRSRPGACRAGRAWPPAEVPTGSREPA